MTATTVQPRAGSVRFARFLGRSSSVAQRLVGALLVIVGVVIVTFLLTRVFAPDPTGLFVKATDDEATRAAVRERLGLDQPLWSQFGSFLAGIVRGDLGSSFLTGRPVVSDIVDRLPATIELSLFALVGGTVLAVVLGVVAAVREGGVIDTIVRMVTVAGLALPQFWLGLMLLWLLFVSLGWLPGPTGRLPITMAAPPHVTGLYLIDSLLAGDEATFTAAFRNLVLPGITLGVGVFAPLARTVRSAMVAALQADHVRTAVAMGIPRPRIWFVYALKNAMMPLITMFAGTIGWLFSGAVLVEGIFGWPGVGQYALNAIQSSDFPAVQGFVLYAAILYVVVYALLDIAYSRIDPRVRS